MSGITTGVGIFSGIDSASAVASNRRTSAGCGMRPFSVPRPWKE